MPERLQHSRPIYLGPAVDGAIGGRDSSSSVLYPISPIRLGAIERALRPTMSTSIEAVGTARTPARSRWPEICTVGRERGFFSNAAAPAPRRYRRRGASPVFCPIFATIGR